ncbi:hypothetical protein QQF64_031220 [Cirrhinus molitorella]|uniref:Uncharacterized protein n=1 Tax=Cirrhinus molitorella TaxID=172907 RepID=A0ABR3MW97_9TELE
MEIIIQLSGDNEALMRDQVSRSAASIVSGVTAPPARSPPPQLRASQRHRLPEPRPSALISFRGSRERALPTHPRAESSH